MDDFDYAAPAELFASKGPATRRRLVTYRRFATAAEAVRYAIEELPADMLAGAAIEVEEARFEAADIRRLYDSPSYPLDRPRP